MGKGIVKLGEGKWAVKDGNLLAAKETNGRFKNTEFTVSRGTRASYVGRDGLIKESNLQDVNLVNNGDFSELGSELVTNGDFATDSDWSKGGGATISGGTGNIIGDGSSFTSLTQANVFTVGKSYKITVDVTINSGLGLKFQDGSTNENFGFATTSGSYTFYGTANNADFVIGRRTGGTAFDSTVDNVSVKEVDPNDYWILGTGWSIEDGVAASDGSQTGNSSIQQSGIAQVGNIYKITFDLVVSSGFINYVNLGGWIDGTNLTTSGTYTYYTDTTTATDNLGIAASADFVGSIDNIVVSELKIDTPRIDFTDNTDGHLLLEPQSTNLITYSEDFSQSAWTKEETIIEGGYTAPDGSNTAYKITNNGSNAHLVGYNGINTGNHKSIWAKTVSGTGDVYLLNRNENNLFSLTNEWQRFDTAHLGLDYFYAVDFRGASVTLSEVIVWGAQLEALSYPTSYIPTNGSTVTRDAETCTDAGEAIDFNSEEGVLYAEIAKFQDDNDNFVLLSLNNSSDNLDDNTVTIGFDSDDDFFIRVQANNVNVFYSNDQTSSKDVYYKIALSYKSGDSKIYINGNSITPNFGSLTGTFSFSSILDNLSFDYDGNGVLPFYGRVKAIKVYKEALSDTDLQNLTS